MKKLLLISLLTVSNALFGMDETSTNVAHLIEIPSENPLMYQKFNAVAAITSPALDAPPYLTNSTYLIHCYDAICNRVAKTKDGVTYYHDDSSMIWQDLVGTNNIVLTSEAIHFTSNSVCLPKRDNGLLLTKMSYDSMLGEAISKYGTNACIVIQACFKMDDSENFVYQTREVYDPKGITSYWGDRNVIVSGGFKKTSFTLTTTNDTGYVRQIPITAVIKPLHYALSRRYSMINGEALPVAVFFEQGQGCNAYGYSDSRNIHITHFALPYVMYNKATYTDKMEYYIPTNRLDFIRCCEVTYKGVPLRQPGTVACFSPPDYLTSKACNSTGYLMPPTDYIPYCLYFYSTLYAEVIDENDYLLRKTLENKAYLQLSMYNGAVLPNEDDLSTDFALWATGQIIDPASSYCSFGGTYISTNSDSLGPAYTMETELFFGTFHSIRIYAYPSKGDGRQQSHKDPTVDLYRYNPNY